MDVVIDDRDEKKDDNGREYVFEVVAYIVPESGEYPSGTKYSFHASYKQPEELILRYDNANEAHKAKHHKHVDEDGEEITKPLDIKPENAEQLQELFQEWVKEVKQIVNEK